MPRRALPRCHKGEGDLDFTTVLDGETAKGRHLNFVHDDILRPGVSIGVHSHERDEEYYLVLTGRGTMWLDGARYDIRAGDIAAVYPGGSHGLYNTGTADMRIIVFSIS
jgi:mannose-6-phosphate isomerase-like protein (cupin superfamily)